jgi:hypothetical protein
VQIWIIKKKWKIGLNDEKWFLNFFWFFGEVSEQSDQVARKPNFWLRTGNNDPKHKDES